MQGFATVLAIWGVKFHNYAHLKYTNNSVTIHYSLFEDYKTLQSKNNSLKNGFEKIIA